MNKSVCVFTQTYSNDRYELFKYHNMDEADIEFRNSFDLNVYSFHNCSDIYINKVINDFQYFSRIKNLEILKYNNLSYSQTWKKSINFLTNNKIEYLVYLQDDVFSTKSSYEIKKMVDIINDMDFNMLNLECSIVNNLYKNLDSKYIKIPEKIFKNIKIYYKKENIIIYDTTSNFFKSLKQYSFDDGPFIAKIDYAIDKLYDDEYFNKENIWDAEGYLNDKILKNSMERLISNCDIYQRYNSFLEIIKYSLKNYDKILIPKCANI